MWLVIRADSGKPPKKLTLEVGDFVGVNALIVY
jgi:hypothetical protein